MGYSNRRLALPIALALLQLAAPTVCGRSTPKPDRELIGWLGEVERETPQKYVGERPPKGERYMEALSWEPRIFLLHHFLSEEEADHLVTTSSPRVRRSGVVNTETGASKLDDIRTSSGTFLSRGQDAVIRTIEKRVAMWTMLDVGHGEGLQVLRYEPTQKYDAHFDYFFHDQGEDNGGNRIATVLLYLSDVEEGGETVFPNTTPHPTQTRKDFSECAMKGLAVKPYKGLAVAFWSLKPSGELDRGSLHGGCPVIKGEKWAATKWYHVGHYAMGGERPKKVERTLHVAPPPPAPPGCFDKDKRCSGWAESGECQNNPIFMVGSEGHPGSCVLSCQRCELMPFTGES